MTVKELRTVLYDADDNDEVFIFGGIASVNNPAQIAEAIVYRSFTGLDDSGRAEYDTSILIKGDLE